jgi:hypothetical protein
MARLTPSKELLSSRKIATRSPPNEKNLKRPQLL